MWSAMRRMLHLNTNRGFTIIEMLVVAPIVILFIGAFIAAIVGMTGEVLTTRSANKLTYDIQDALNRIEQDVNSSAAFLSKNNISITPPQGYNNDNTNFKNVDSTNGNMLILNVYATTKNPQDVTSQVIYTKNQPNTCASPNIASNPPVMLNIVYFVKNNALYRRVLAPSFYDTVGCSVPWQTPSCARNVTGSLCKGVDVSLVSGIASFDDFKIDYYPSQSSTAPNATAVDTSSTNPVRQTALQSTNSIKVTINATSTIAGRTFSQSGTIRANSPNNDTGATANVQALQVTSNPSDSTVNSGSNATFTATVSGTSPTVQWQQSTNNGTTWTNISGATSTSLTRSAVTNAMDGYRYRAVFTNSLNQVTTSSARLGVNYLSWTDIGLSSGWSNYGGVFNTAAYLKTTSGVVTLKGLIKKSSAVTANEVVATLPVSYRPTGTLIFSTSTNANVYSQLQIYPNGNIAIVKGDAGWISLEGIHFIPDNGKYDQTTLTPLYNGWSNYTAVYSGDYAIPAYAVDDIGRVHLQGVVTGGSLPDNTLIANLSSNLRPSLYMHVATANNNYALIGISATNGIVAKGGTTSSGYLALQAMYYPASVGSWTNIPLINGWVTYDANSFSTPQFTKAADGLVSLKGLIRSGTATAGTTIGNLPPGFRPLARVLYGVASNGAYGRLDIYPTGELVINAGSNAWFSLDNVTFYANN